jgi:tRNA modification GTPase
VRVAIVGRPNVGKSSLLNALLREDRAIVTPVAGTTRDVIAESITLHGIPVVLLDTAGIADTTDQIEQLGFDRSRAALTAAALVLFVLDASQEQQFRHFCPPRRWSMSRHAPERGWQSSRKRCTPWRSAQQVA